MDGHISALEGHLCVSHSHLPLILCREVELQQLRGRLHEELLAVEWQDAVVVLGGEVWGKIL